jgi:D-alanine-D-alanine ligase
VKNKKKILVLMGGMSRERPVSIQSGRACYNAIKKLGYNVYKYDPLKNISSNIKKIKPDVAFNSLHGKYGEDGKIQKILERLKIPYTHSGIKASQIAMDKIKSKKIFIKKKINTPDFKIIKKISDINNKISESKFIIKPSNEGSSFGVKIFKPTSKSQSKIIKKLLKKYKTLIQETYIQGKEIQTAVLGSKPIGSVEIVPSRKFYDYKAKYSSNAKTKHIVPPNISKNLHNKIKRIALKAHCALNCRGVTRCDFIVTPNNKIYLLEINTQPGMTKLSLVPEIALNFGLTFIQLIDWMIKDASIKR